MKSTHTLMVVHSSAAGMSAKDSIVPVQRFPILCGPFENVALLGNAKISCDRDIVTALKMRLSLITIAAFCVQGILEGGAR